MITSFFKPKAVETSDDVGAPERVDSPAAALQKASPSPAAELATPSDAVGGKADGASETEVQQQQPARKRLRKTVIRDDDEDDDAAAEPTEAETRTEQTLAYPAPAVATAPTTASPAAAPASVSASAALPIQAYFKGRATSAQVKPVADAAKGAPASSAEAGTSKEADATDEDVDDAHGGPTEEEEGEDKAGEEKGEDTAGKRQLTLFGAGAVAKVAGSAAKGKASLLDLKAYQSYDPAAAATWAKGGDIPFSYLTSIFSKIEAESKRLLITQLMANCFRTVIATSPTQLHATICVATNKIAASYEGLELGVGDAIMIKAVAETCGKSVDAVKAQLEEEGDLGTVAASARRKQITFGKLKPLVVSSVLASFLELARASGKDVMTRKKEKIKQMLVAAQGSEAQYIVRALQGKMRIGLAEQTVLVALAHAIVLTPPPLEAAEESDEPFAPGRPGGPGGTLPKGDALVALLAEAEAVVKRVYCEMPNYEVITRVLLTHGLAKLHHHAHLTAGIPIKPMLAKPTKGISEVLDRMSDGRFTCEFKYDGERAQIHKLPDGTVKVFSRNSEDMTSKYPDIALVVPRATAEGVDSFIIDAEAVAMDRATGEIRPFQVLSTRKRKDATVDNITVQVCVFAFDLLYLNGEPLLREQFARRRELLHKTFNPIPKELEFARASDVSDEDGIAEWLGQSIKGNCEGLMVKTLDQDATYEPSKRSLNWLKVKKDYLQGMTDSCDLVPIGAYFGKGKRTGVYGAFLLACYNEQDEEYQSICKIGTGFSDTALHELADSLNPRRIEGPRAYYRVPETPALTPDVWFEAAQVWEVLAADLSISPVHQAAVGLVDNGKGIALRFPRFLRVRDDKGPEDATSASQVAQMYNDQACTRDTNNGNDDEDDF